MNRIKLIDTKQKLIKCLQELQEDLGCYEDLTSSEVLFCDFEGVELGKDGQLCIGQFATRSSTFLVDFVVLGKDAATLTHQNISLKSLLESPGIKKVIFDPRKDSLALYFQYEIAMKNVICLQLMEAACRRKRGLKVTYVKGLSSLLPSSTDQIKEEGKSLFLQNPLVWKERPLQPAVLAYSKSDVEGLIPLYDEFKSQLNGNWMHKVERLTKQRVEIYNTPNATFSAVAPSFK